MKPSQPQAICSETLAPSHVPRRGNRCDLGLEGAMLVQEGGQGTLISFLAP